MKRIILDADEISLDLNSSSDGPNDWAEGIQQYRDAGFLVVLTSAFHRAEEVQRQQQLLHRNGIDFDEFVPGRPTFYNDVLVDDMSVATREFFSLPLEGVLSIFDQVPGQ